MPEVITDIEIPASPGLVWSVLTDLDSYPQWNPVITKLKVKGNLRSGASGTLVIKIDAGKPKVLSMNYHEVEPGKAFSWTGGVLGDWFLRGLHYFRTEALPNGGTRLVHGERFQGLVFILMWPMLKNKVETSYNKMNQAVKNRCEVLAQTGHK